ncbi:phosphatidylinositol-glycan biosynthesis class S protein domain-containing protein [Phthorimaea operculella]|nr:phosphatidylinositol-glycan biosynthesis class S protein domain-containing protein [Phthorimaea operculella]
MWASASFVGVLFIIGLPLWWKTTEVYRVALPYDKINSFDPLAHSLTAELTVLANDDATASEVAGLIEKSFEDIDVLKLKINKAVISEQLHHTLYSVADEQEAIEEVAKSFDLGAHNKLYIVQRTPLFENVWVGTQRVVFFRNSQAATTLVRVLQDWIYQTSVLQGAKAQVADQARRTRFPPGESYHIALSVVQPRPDVNKVEFDAKNAVEAYVGSFVDELSILHNFTLKSQWLFMLDFDFQEKEVKDSSEWGRHFKVSQDRMHLLLTRLEERAATHVSESPTINLALYTVPCDKAPMVIYDSRGEPVKSSVQAFMSPKWGGVVLSSPTAGECRGEHPTHKPVPRVVMGAFISQLRKLLGITEYTRIEGAHMVPLRAVAPRSWERDTLLRLRSLEQVSSAQRTLQSLAQLLGEISNIVINDEVGACINTAVDKIHEAMELMTRGHLTQAYDTSLAAFTHAETAFMEPSLLALLYFPDDQKYAVYIPLFLPIMFPVSLTIKNLFLWFRGKPIHSKQD